MDFDAQAKYIIRLLAEVDALKAFAARSEPMLLAYEAHVAAEAADASDVEDAEAQDSGTTDGVESNPETPVVEAAASQAEAPAVAEQTEPVATEEPMVEQTPAPVVEESEQSTEAPAAGEIVDEPAVVQEEPAVEAEEPKLTV